MIGGTGTIGKYNKDDVIEDINEVFDNTAKRHWWPLLTACHVLCIRGSIFNFAQVIKQLFNMALGNGNVLSRDEWIQVFSDQMPQFTMLAVKAKDNQIAIFHSISQLLVSPGFNHKNNNDILAFMNDADDLDSLPTIMKLDKNNFDTSV